MGITLTSTYDELTGHFYELLHSPFSFAKKPDPTFLDISGFPSYENVFSNIYQFFLNDKENGFNNLFFSALLDCIPDHEINMNSWVADREFTTEKRGRVDLVIREDKDEPTEVILIENKVYHTVQNNLDDYSKCFPDATKKVCILLTLKETPVTNGFINLTHQKWIENIKARSGQYLAGVSPRYVWFLLDFIQHVESYYKKSTSMESIKFLYNFSEKIAALNQLQSEAIEHIKKDLIGPIPDSWKYYRSSNNSVAIVQKESGQYLYVTVDGLFKPGDHHFIMQLWIYGKDNVDIWKTLDTPESINRFCERVGIKIKKSNNTKEWSLVADKKYQISMDDIVRFGEVVHALVAEEWNPLIDDLNNTLQAHRRSH